MKQFKVAGLLLASLWLVAAGCGSESPGPSETATASPAATATATLTMAVATDQPAPVPRGGEIRITGILRDGHVPQTETDEYVEITNVGDGPVDLTGWRLESERRGDDDQQIFRFPAGFTMSAGQVCRIFTNEDHPEWCGLSFRHGRSGVWANNDPDAALLIDATGAVVQRRE